MGRQLVAGESERPVRFRRHHEGHLLALTGDELRAFVLRAPHEFA